MKRITYVLLVFSFIILLVSSVNYYVSTKDMEVKSFFTSVNVTDSLGFDVNGTALTFGNVIFDGSSTRYFIYENTDDYPVLLKIKSDGDIKPYLQFDDKVRVEKGEKKKIAFSAVMDGAGEGPYSGNVEFKIIPL